MEEDSWYSRPVMILLLLLGIGLWAKVNHDQKQRIQAITAPPQGRYFCDSCKREWVMPYQGPMAVVLCPSCGPLFQELERTVDWNAPE